MENQTFIQNNGGGEPITTRPVIEVNIAPKIEDFIAAVHAGVAAWETAGAMLVKMLEANKRVFTDIVTLYPFITIDTLEVFHSIGLRALYPLTMFLPRTVLPMVRRMRYDAQKQVTENPVQLVSRMIGGAPVIVRKPVAKLSADEARRCLWPKGNLSVETQVRKMNDKITKALTRAAPKLTEKEAQRLPVSKGKFVVRRGTGGQFIFEKTMATPYNTQRVMLESGQAVIELCEWGGA